jgi:hypothetical protein
MREAEAARTACTQAYRSLATTQRLVAEAKGPPIDREKLAAAERELGLTRGRLEACGSATVALRRALGR